MIIINKTSILSLFVVRIEKHVLFFLFFCYQSYSDLIIFFLFIKESNWWILVSVGGQTLPVFFYILSTLSRQFWQVKLEYKLKVFSHNLKIRICSHLADILESLFLKNNWKNIELEHSVRAAMHSCSGCRLHNSTGSIIPL